MTDQIDSFVGRNSDLFSKLIKKAKEGKDVDVEEHYPIVSEKRAIKKVIEEKKFEIYHHNFSNWKKKWKKKRHMKNLWMMILKG